MTCVMGVSVELMTGERALPLRCTDCGRQVLLVAPVSIDDLAALARAFEDRHAECVLDKKEQG